MKCRFPSEGVVSEEILRIWLEELATVRIVCRHDECGRVYEMPVGKLAEGKQDFKCVCGTVLRLYDKAAGAMTDGFADLAAAIAAIKKISAVRCEFVLPVSREGGKNAERP